MAVLTIDMVPQHQHLLRRISAPAINDNALAELSYNMFQTLDDLGMGVGLSAIQVGVPARMFIMDANRRFKGMGYSPRTVVNPLIIERSPEMIVSREGCLSLPETYGESGRVPVLRHKWIRIRYETLTKTMAGFTFGGETVEEVLEGDESVLGQHELDHLDGRLITDYLPEMIDPRPDVPIRQLAAE